MTEKRIQTLRARAALVGMTLEAIRDDREREAYVLTMGAQTLTVRSLGDVERQIAQGWPAPATEGSHA